MVGNLEREGGRRVEHLDVICHHLDLTGRDRRVRVPIGALPYCTRDLENEFGSQLVGDLLADDDLGDPGGITQIDKGNPAVVPAAIHPSGQGDGVANVAGA